MLSRTLFIKASIVLFMTIASLFSCGGGSDSGDNTVPNDDFGAVKETFQIDSQSVNGITYSISVGLPPLYADAGSPHPAIFILDGKA